MLPFPGYTAGTGVGQMPACACGLGRPLPSGRDRDRIGNGGRAGARVLDEEPDSGSERATELQGLSPTQRGKNRVELDKIRIERDP